MSSSVSLTGKNSQGEIKRLKLVLLGESAVGKSSVLKKYAENLFFDSMPTTIGANLQTPTMKIDNKFYNLEIWDTAGQERFHSLIPMYYRGAHAAVVIYDMTKRESFLKAQSWVRELKQKASNQILIALVANKSDLDQKRDVLFNEATCYAEDNGLLFVEVSAKTGLNINELFTAIVRTTTDANKNEHIQQIASQQSENSNKNSCC